MRTRESGTVEATTTNKWLKPKRHLGVLTLLIAIGASACGGSTDTVAQDSPDTASATTGSSAAGVEGTSSDTTSGDTGSIPVATVVIDGESYTFSEEGFAASANCSPSRNGVFTANLRLVDENGELVSRSHLDLELALNAGDAKAEENAIDVSFLYLDESSSLNYRPGWWADAAYAENLGLDIGVAQVDSYDINGNTVSGTATFVSNESSADFQRGDVNSVESAQGSFTVTCK